MMRLPPLWRPGLCWLVVLAPLFFISYGAANHHAAGLPAVPSIVFDWERWVPLWPWTILPYWSIDLFYGLSLLICRDRLELAHHARRLLTAQLIAVACFFLFPLRYSVSRPPLQGWSGRLFDALAGFDLPYNQAPSLHIVLLLILWDFYRRRTRGAARAVVHGWSLLIGVSVLTTWQHHFIDIPTGLLVGLLCLWLWPLDGARPQWQWPADGVRRRLALLYGAGAAALSLLAVLAGRTGWWLFWPAASLLLVALCYASVGAGGFQKRSDGRHTLASRWLFAPYRLGAWINARLWTRCVPPAAEVCDGVWIGRLPRAGEPEHRQFHRILDVSAELSVRHPRLHALPQLDLVVPAAAQLRAAAEHLQRLAGQGSVLVCCALGYSRSAAVVLAWLCLSGRAPSVAAAADLLRRARPQVVLKPALLQAVAQAIALPSPTP